MKISVIVPAYNIEKYIVRCLTSLHVQKFDEAEFLIIDDGSTDNTADVIKKYINEINDKRFKYYIKENGGQADARNFGLSKANGRYIWYVDGDDYICEDSDTLNNLYSKAIQKDVEVLIFNLKYNADWSSKYANKIALSIKENDEVMTGIESLNSKEFSFSVWHMLFKKDFLRKSGITFKKGSTAEDLLYSFEVLLKAKRVKFIPNAAYIYTYRQDSITKSADPIKVKKRINDVLEVTLEINSKLSNMGLAKSNLANLLVSGYIAQSLTAFATGYVDISRKKLFTFFKGKKLNYKQYIKKIIMLYFPAKLRQKLCKKIMHM